MTLRGMSKEPPSKSIERWLPRPLLLSLLLGCAAMLLAFWDLWRHTDAQFSQGVMQLLYEQFLRSRVTVIRAGVFVAEVTGLYLLMGLLALVLTGLAAAEWKWAAQHRRACLVAWFAMLWSMVGLANAALYPWSKTGTWSRNANALLPQLVAPWQWLLIACAILVLVLLWRRAARKGSLRRLYRVLVWGGLIVAATVILVSMPRDRSQQDAAATGRRPNVVFLGIDSLRPDVVGTPGTLGFTPSISAFLADAHRYADATTPLARTFPSWMTLLTGRSPVTTGARENLVPLRTLRYQGALPERLRAAGYQTVYATDEVRFSNIDGRYGFDRTITPRIGASDFLLGAMNDLPLTNLLANTWISRWLFPETYANRAAAVTYDPASFVQRLRREVPESGSAPTFLAMHLTLPHWPYQWRADGDRIMSRTTDNRYAYLATVVAVDHQFADVLRVLDDKGYMHNTIFVVFSDHGEALNAEADNPILSREAKLAAGRVPVWMSGHGTSVLSFPQYHVLLAVRCEGVRAGCPGSGIDRNAAVTMEDVAPSVLDLAGVSYPKESFEGHSLVAPEGLPAERIRFTESAYSTPSLREGEAKTGDLLAEGAGVFQVDAASGRVELNPDHWQEVLDVRERAAIGPSKILAAIPAEAAGRHKYVLVARDGSSLPRRLYGPPDAVTDPEGSGLWRALQERYPKELGEAARDQGIASDKP